MQNQNRKKGQISFAEYLISIVVFVSFVGYFSFQLLNFVPAYLTQIRNEEARSEAYQLSDILINDPGYPINWQSNTGAIQRIGLNDASQNLTNVISDQKLNQFISLCQGNGYFNIKRWFGTSNDFSIVISEINSYSGTTSAIVACKPPAEIVRAINTSIKRFADINSTYFSQIIIQVV